MRDHPDLLGIGDDDAVNVGGKHVDDSSCVACRLEGASGRHDNYGSALAAHPGLVAGAAR